LAKSATFAFKEREQGASLSDSLGGSDLATLETKMATLKSRTSDEQLYLVDARPVCGVRKDGRNLFGSTDLVIHDTQVPIATAQAVVAFYSR
jgi:hypothetical protein